MQPDLCSHFGIVCVDGYPVDGLNAHEMSELQRGPLGSTVALTIAPLHSELAPQTIYLERRPLPQPPLKQVPKGRQSPPPAPSPPPLPLRAQNCLCSQHSLFCPSHIARASSQLSKGARRVQRQNS